MPLIGSVNVTLMPIFEFILLISIAIKTIFVECLVVRINILDLAHGGCGLCRNDYQQKGV